MVSDLVLKTRIQQHRVDETLAPESCSVAPEPIVSLFCYSFAEDSVLERCTDNAQERPRGSW